MFQAFPSFGVSRSPVWKEEGEEEREEKNIGEEQSNRIALLEQTLTSNHTQERERERERDSYHLAQVLNRLG